jgi:hypothetical protein
MTIYRYPRGAVAGDFARAGFGLALTGGPALAVPAGSAAQIVLGLLAVLFLAFAVRTWQRGRAQVTVTQASISISAPRQVSLSWQNLKSVRLNYYSTKSDRAGGWMQLTLKGEGGPDGGVIRVDSALEGFREVAREAAAAARASKAELTESTRANFSALGIAFDD